MAGVLTFFYVSALKETHDKDSDKLPNCTHSINETGAPTYDLILSVSLLEKCNGASVIYNYGSIMILIVLSVMFFRGWKWIKPVKKWIPDSIIISILGLIIGFINRQSGYIYFGYDVLMVDMLKFIFLPMMILNSAYGAFRILNHHEQLRWQIDDILLFSVVGTIIKISGILLSLKGLNYTTGLPSLPYYTEASNTPRISWSQFLVFATILGAVDNLALFPENNILDRKKKIVAKPITVLIYGQSTLSNALTYTLFTGLAKVLNLNSHRKIGVDEEFPIVSLVCVFL